ncbi:hypothetical protein ACFVIM_24970 [Streptomyces sp. NPDC057638]|uniref:hypothetical protein n=1 Tax=Streptomyces sp. NPDC057638 TaxID=3346190 RepID=UPI0036CDF267
MSDSVMAVLLLPLVAVGSTTALAFLATSALRLSSADRTDPSDEARSLTLALYGCVVALATLMVFVSCL